MGLFRKIYGILGFSKESHDARHHEEEQHVDADDGIRTAHGDRAPVEPIPGVPRKGFSVPVQVPVERSNSVPLIVPCNGDGGVQGLNWYVNGLKIDEDGDVADEFLNQISDDSTHNVNSLEFVPKLPKFQVKCTRPVKVRNQVMLLDGRLQCKDGKGNLMLL